MSVKPLASRRLLAGRAWTGAWVLAVCLAGGPSGVSTSPAGLVSEGNRSPVLSGIFPPGIVIGTTTHWTVTGRRLGAVERFLVSGEGVAVVSTARDSDGRISAVVKVDPGASPGFREVRVDGPAGVSNLLLVRVDSLPQLVESEPNDDLAHGNQLALGLAVAGVLEPRGLDHFVVSGQAGGLMVLEVEARRLGTPIAPVATVLSPSGNSLMQVGETRGIDGDCRTIFRFPQDGRYVIQIRDRLYRGGAGARYRLRVTASPLATGLFPLGGVAGETIEVTASGGTLTDVRRQRVTLPSKPGAIVELGPFEGRGAPVVVTQRLTVGQGPDVLEGPANADGPTTTRLPLGATANGRIDRPKEIDAYLVRVRHGDRIRVSVRAVPLGSWLDSVVTLRNSRGQVLGENDDRLVRPTGLAGPGAPGLDPASADSLLEHDVTEDGDLRVEIGDRFGDGGPEYAYRITVGPADPDFALEFAPAPGAEGDSADDDPGGQRSDAEVGDGSEAVLNLAPGATRQVRVAVTPRGRGGAIVIRAMGLPPGVSAEPLTVRPLGGRGNSSADPGQPPVLNAVVNLRAAPDARPGLGELRLVATAVRPDGTSFAREGSTAVVLTTAPISGVRRPVVREVHALPVKIVSPRGPDR